MNSWNKTVLACLTLVALAVAPAVAAPPRVTVKAATPSSAYQGDTLDVVVSGSGFDPTARVNYLVTGTTNSGQIQVLNVVFQSSQQLVTTIKVSEQAILEYYDIQVVLDSGRKGKGTTLFSVRLKNGTTESYNGENLGVLPGGSDSDAWDVNAAGNVVGRSYFPMKGFYWNGTMHELPGTAEARNTPPFNVGWDVEVWGISDGPAEVAVGYEERTICGSKNEPCDRQYYPILWTGELSQGPDAVRLDVDEGWAMGINAAGTMAAGICGGGAGAFWTRNGGEWTRWNIPLGAFVCEGCAFATGYGSDVNDSGIVVGHVERQDDYRQLAYVFDTQRANGVVLPVPLGFIFSNAWAVSNVRDGKFYVAGLVASCANTPCDIERGIRWTVDAATLSASYEVLMETAWTQAVSDQGFVAGTHNSTNQRRPGIIQTAVLWKETSGYVQLKPPTGSDSTSRSMAVGADGTVYVVGESNSKGHWTASRWVIR